MKAGILWIAGCMILMAATSACSEKNTNTEQKLNVLFIAVDDLRPELGCYGNDFIERNKNRPFFLYLSHFAPHTILNGKPNSSKCAGA